MRSTMILAALAAILTLTTGSALAGPYGTVDVGYTNVSPGMNVGVWSSNTNYTGGSSFWLGVFNLNLANVSGVSPSWEPYLTGSVQSFCIDIWDLPSTSVHTYDVLPLDEAPDPQAAPYGNGMGALRAAYLSTLLDTYWVDNLTNLEAAALQASVWEIVDEGSQTDAVGNPLDWNVATGEGNFYVGNPDVAARANEMLAAVVEAGANFSGGYVALGNPSLFDQNPKPDNYQDFVVRVPVPGAALLALFGLGAAGMRLRKRQS